MEKAKDVYTVESIVAHRKNALDQYEYFLKWKDWPRDANTWEPEHHLHCHELLYEYKRKMIMKKNDKKIKTPKGTESKNEKMKILKEAAQVNIRRDPLKNDDETSRTGRKIPVHIDNRDTFAVDSSMDPNNTNNDSTKNNNIKRARKRSVAVSVGEENTSSFKKTRFDRNLELKKILAASQNEKGEMMFLISWKGTRETEEMLAKEANLKFPQQVIDFYHERMSWDT